MPLPSPIQAVYGFFRFLRNAFLAICALIVLVPTVHWGFMVVGIVLCFFGHVASGIVLFALGMTGRMVSKSLGV